MTAVTVATVARAVAAPTHSPRPRTLCALPSSSDGSHSKPRSQTTKRTTTRHVRWLHEGGGHAAVCRGVSVAPVRWYSSALDFSCCTHSRSTQISNALAMATPTRSAEAPARTALPTVPSPQRRMRRSRARASSSVGRFAMQTPRARATRTSAARTAATTGKSASCTTTACPPSLSRAQRMIRT